MKRPVIVALALSPLALAVPIEQRQNTSCGKGITKAEASRVSSALGASGIIPTLVTTINPLSEVNVAYGNVPIDLGTETTTLQTVIPPKINFTAPTDGGPDQRYSFFMLDPDIPIVQNPRVSALHWHIANLPACGGAEDSKLVSLYVPPIPASVGEQHRYTWLVYREPTGYKPDFISVQARLAFDLQGYTTRAGLGNPIGGNFMRQSITNGILPSL